jgi:uncharacterized protein (DUF2062 family)/2-polyprenyl-3-methyl-5-hydroxy-6-metoxy-1,4-benzoquinol methylase
VSDPEPRLVRPGAPPPVPEAAGSGPLHRKRSWLRRLYMTLRTEHRTPRKVAFAVGVGAFVGSSPLWGLHLAICFFLAMIFRLNRMIVYAASNVGNPLTGPPLVFAELQVGHRLLNGAWLPISVADVEAVGFTGLVANLAVGTLVVGAAVGALCGFVAWLVSRTGRHAADYLWVADQIVIRYVDVSIRDAEAARAALLGDPIYPFLLEERYHEPGLRILDLGCGRALAGALLGIFNERPESRWYLGVDACERYVRTARQVLGDIPGCSLQTMDLRDFDPPAADVVILNDVLRYLPFTAQDALLRRLARAMPPGARIFAREKDAGRGIRFRLLAFRDALSILVPGRPRHGHHYRRAEDLRNALVAAGFGVVDRTILRGTSPAWMVVEAVRRPAAVPKA